jgi:DNA-binding CsgD family transcriptional regulator
VTAPRFIVLTRCQSAVLDELAKDGADNQVIADRLGISPETVKSHVRAVMAEIGASNRTAAAVAYLHRRVTVHVVESRRWPARGDVVHMGPTPGAVLLATGCCHRLLNELPETDTVTRAPDRVTCRKAA